MGRHSIPDPEKSGRQPTSQAAEGAAFAARGGRNDGEWTGSHRTVQPGRRGVSVGVIVALVTVVVVVAGVILWRFFGAALSDRSDVAAERCLEGEANVAVLADPAIADTVSGLGRKFNETAGPVGDHCVAVHVTAADSDTVLDGLTGTWPGDLGDKPALWIPASSIATARLQAAAGPAVVSTSTSLASSPVLIATSPKLKDALSQQNWSTLPGLQADPAALDGLGLPGWGSLRLALPSAGDSDAALLAGEAVAAASAGQDAPATSGIGALGRLVAGQPEPTGTSLDDAMTALLQGGDPAAAPVHAVVLTEQQLFHRAAGLPDAKAALAGWLPPGPVPVADFPAVLLTGDWVSPDQASAASEFERFLRKPEQIAELAKAGFRVPDAASPPSDVTTFAPLESTLSVGDDAVRVRLADVFSAPEGGQATSIMLDRSLNLPPVVEALKARIAVLPPTAAVGLTTFGGGESATAVTLGGLADQVDGRPRNEQLDGVLDGLSPAAGGVVSFTTLRNVYADALTNFRSQQPNTVLVITSGPHADQSLGGEGLKELLRASADPARPVAVNVINVGDDPDRQVWEAVAQITGGSYFSVPGSDAPELGTALGAALR